jgi:Tol biopolymer transport system component
MKLSTLIRSCAALAFTASAFGQATTRVSVSATGAQGNDHSSFPSISADGRFVAFESDATNLVTGDTNGTRDILVKDRQTGAVELVSVSSSGVQGDGISEHAAISADGRYVAFLSSATNLVAGDTNGVGDIFVHDRQTGATERVSVATNGTQGNDYCIYPVITPDGRFVAFPSYSSNLVAGDTNADVDVFVRDRLNGTTERVSVASDGTQGDGGGALPSISADGRFVSFFSWATNLVPGDTNGFDDAFVHDRWTGATERISVATNGTQGDSDSRGTSMSADGRFVAFVSAAANFDPADTNGRADIYVHDRQSGTTERVSVATNGTQGNQDSWWPSISADGNRVAFASYASTLVPNDTNVNDDVFVHDRAAGTTERVSVDSGGAQADYGGDVPWISADGRYAAFASSANNLVSGDTNGKLDVFVRDHGPVPPGTDLCQASAGDVRACPCSNPPANSPRGCDNSAATGGAQLTSSGTASLANDTLVFVTNGELASATSILIQGNAEVLGGVGFGQGVRCAGGALWRLFVKTAAGGSISAPASGEPSISARSAMIGDTLGPLSIRWYAVYYADPNVLGGCSAARQFNTTQTQRVVWLP